MGLKIAIEAARTTVGAGYPAPYAAACATRVRARLGEAAGLTQFGVNLLRLPPGGWSSQRHWHTSEDEFVLVLEGEVILVTDGSEEVLQAGDCAGFKAGVANGHHLQNRAADDAVVLEIGSRYPADDATFYPDIDLCVPPGSKVYAHRDGQPYPDD